MLIKQSVLQQIAASQVSLAFRKWRRPTVKAGGTLRTPCGVLAIDSVDLISLNTLRERDAIQAGFASLADLLVDLKSQRTGRLYRITLRLVGPDARIALRRQGRLSRLDLAEITTKLERLDARGRHGPWTTLVLRAIAASPGTKATELSAAGGFEKEWLKTNIRKLKELGLTESLSPGYRISPRGKAVLAQLGKP